ncbi:MAG TPA: hypothetical protein VFF28_00725 [Candidatus Nanoarchaeia archaeon]|nr:hypothetical protein [Candidatus Nanoarchaeia archaeon]
MIYKFEALNELFKQIDGQLSGKVSLFILGGAALLHYGVGKGYTKDIDIVFDNYNQFVVFKHALTCQKSL